MCGIVWIFDLERKGDKDLPRIALDLLRGNRNRGQEWYGLSVITETEKILTYKFQDINDPNIYEALSDIKDKIIWIIWHARYPTSWWKDMSHEDIQPFSMWVPEHDFTFAFNGNIANAEDIAERIEATQWDVFPRPILDTKVLQHMILDPICNGESDTKKVLEWVNEEIDGACNIVLAWKKWDFTIAKDRWWFRPLSYAHVWGLFTFSSESDALFRIGIDEPDMKFLKTGQAVKFDSITGKIDSSLMQLESPRQKSRCFFETVYFANRKTKLWWEASSNHRYRVWQNLAKNDYNTFSREDTVVIDVPESSRDCAEGFADHLNLPLFSTALTKNPLFNKRSFIWATKEDRLKILENKYIFNPDLKPFIKGKKLALVDDSIVRGSTLEFLIEKLQVFYEPSEIHIRIPSPPIIAPCYYAINLKHPKELLARKFFEDPCNPQIQELDTLAEHLKANTIRYIDIEGLIDALRVDVKEMCLACVTWQFPTPKGREIFAEQLQETL